MSQAELFCLVGVCGRWAVYPWYGLSPVVLAAGPTLMQGRLSVWSIRYGYMMALGQFLLGYAAGVYPAWMVLGAAGLGAGLYARLELRVVPRDDAAKKGRCFSRHRWHHRNSYALPKGQE